VHLHLFHEFRAIDAKEAGQRVVVGFFQELDAARLCQLLERLQKTGIPTLALLKENPRNPIRNFKLLPFSLEFFDLVLNDLVRRKIAFPGGTVENVLVQCIIEIKLEKVLLGNRRMSQ
jgi:hypothetical protein